MKTYEKLSPLDCPSSAYRLYNFVSFGPRTNAPTGKPWAHEKLNEAIDIQFAIHRSIIEAQQNVY